MIKPSEFTFQCCPALTCAALPKVSAHELSSKAVASESDFHNLIYFPLSSSETPPPHCCNKSDQIAAMIKIPQSAHLPSSNSFFTDF